MNRPRSDQLWKIWFCLATLLTVIYFAAPESRESKLLLYNGTGLLSIVMILYGVRRNKPTQRAPWIWFACGLGSFLVADVLELVSKNGPPFPSIADVFYLAMYPLVIVGLAKMHRSVSTDKADSSFVVAAIVGVSEHVQSNPYNTEIRVGIGEIGAAAGEIDEIDNELHVPVMATWPWLRQWCESFPDWTPYMIGVRRGSGGRLVGCALLARRERGHETALVAMGTSSSLCTVLRAIDHDASAALADAIASFLVKIPGLWSLEIEQVHELDPTLQRLSEVLDHAHVLPEMRVPRVMFSADQRLDVVLSSSMRKQLRRATARIDALGLTTSVTFDRGPTITPELVDEVEAVHISRDRFARRGSDLDRPSERAFWRTIVEGRQPGCEVEVGSLRIDGELAAYVVALLDRRTYRVYDGRMDTRFADYSPGRLIEAAALDRALKDPRFTVLDWMSGVAAEKLISANTAEGRLRLVASSAADLLQTTGRLGREREFAN